MTMTEIKFVILLTKVTFYIQMLNQYIVYFMITSKTCNVNILSTIGWESWMLNDVCKKHIKIMNNEIFTVRILSLCNLHVTSWCWKCRYRWDGSFEMSENCRWTARSKIFFIIFHIATDNCLIHFCKHLFY